MEAAKGEFFAFLDSDAVYVPHKLQVQMDKIQEDGSDIVWGQVKFVFLDGREYSWPDIDEGTINNLDTLIPLSLQQGLINTNTLFFNRLCYEICGGFDESLQRFQEWDLWLRMLLSNKFKVKFIKDILAINFLQKDSISSNDEILVEAHCTIVQKHMDAFRQYDSLQTAWKKLFQYWTSEYELSNLRILRNLIDSLTNEERVSFLCDAFTWIGEQNVQIEALVKNVEKRKLEKKLMDWHFPRERIPANSRIVIYGAGDVGTSFVKQIAENHWYSIVLWVDRDYQQKGSIVHSPDEISNCFFDYIVVAISNEKKITTAVDYLTALGVPSEKIVKITL